VEVTVEVTEITLEVTVEKQRGTTEPSEEILS
jgi:hypothetical protein